VAQQAQVTSLQHASAAVESFLQGGLPEQPSKPVLEPAVREWLLSPVPAPWRTALLAEGRKRWAQMAPPPKGLRQAGPVLLGRLQALADALGVPRPGCVMDPASNGVNYAGPELLVVGIGVFSLPARAQDYVLARAIARASLGLPFAAEGVEAWLTDVADAQKLASPPHAELLEPVAEALAAAVVDDALGAMVGQTTVDPRFARADPRAWDRQAALDGPAQKGAAAVLAAILARMSVQ
jgi:hypothetical protein